MTGSIAQGRPREYLYIHIRERDVLSTISDVAHGLFSCSPASWATSLPLHFPFFPPLYNYSTPAGP